MLHSLYLVMLLKGTVARAFSLRISFMTLVKIDRPGNDSRLSNTGGVLQNSKHSPRAWSVDSSPGNQLGSLRVGNFSHLDHMSLGV
jgi:hypothetical protein